MYEVEIQNGLDLLDRELGRDVWLDRIKPERIEMASCENCVAAQATGVSYSNALVALGVVSESLFADALENSSYPIPDKIAGLEVHYGFEIYRDEHTSVEQILYRYDMLEREWQDVIAAMKFPD